MSNTLALDFGCVLRTARALLAWALPITAFYETLEAWLDANRQQSTYRLQVTRAPLAATAFFGRAFSEMTIRDLDTIL